MAQFKVLKPYNDLELKREFKANDEVEMTVKRSEKIEKTLKNKGYDGQFLERTDVKDEEE